MERSHSGWFEGIDGALWVRDGIVNCAKENGSGGGCGLIDKDPPAWCPHKLEHAVAEGMCHA
jgi:hypothetical protein